MISATSGAMLPASFFTGMTTERSMRPTRPCLEAAAPQTARRALASNLHLARFDKSDNRAR
jgi:hypothetical protein